MVTLFNDLFKKYIKIMSNFKKISWRVSKCSISQNQFTGTKHEVGKTKNKHKQRGESL